MAEITNHQNVIPINQQINDSNQRIVIGPCDEGDASRLKVIKRDVVVEQIQITCNCGEIIQLDCRYKK